MTIKNNVISAKAISSTQNMPYGIHLSGVFSGGSIKNNEVTSDWIGISLDGNSNVDIKNNTVQASLTGISVIAGSDITIRNNTVTSVTAITANNVPNLIINNNVLSVKRNTTVSAMPPLGIAVSQTSPVAMPGLSVSNNVVNSEYTSIQINGFSGVGIDGAEVKENIVTIAVPSGVPLIAPAITVSYCPNIRVIENVISANAILGSTSTPVGVRFLNGVTNGLIEKNTITSDYTGIRLNNVMQVRVHENTISSIVGIDTVGPGAPDVIINDNLITAISNTKFATNPIGISLTGSFTNGLIENNSIHAEYYGIYLNGPSNLVLRNNTICTSYSGTSNAPKGGIFANSAPYVVIKNNVISAKVTSALTMLSGINLGGNFLGGSIINNEINSDLYGISLRGPSNMKILNNTVTALTGIQATNTPNLVIGNNTVTALAGITATNATNLVIGNNVVSAKANPAFPSQMPVGIMADGNFPGGSIKNNEVTSDWVGIGIGVSSPSVGPSNIEVRNNMVTAAIGIAAGKTPNIKVSENKIYAKRITTPMLGDVGWGIVFCGSFSGGLIENNEINSEVTGIYFDNLMGIGVPSNINIQNNKISGNFKWGISINFTSSSNTISANNITGGNQPEDIGIYLGKNTSNNIVTNNIISGVDIPIDDDDGNIIIT